MQNSRRQENVKEDGPKMRSVGMMQPRSVMVPAMPLQNPMHESGKFSNFPSTKSKKLPVSDNLGLLQIIEKGRKGTPTWKVGKLINLPGFHVLERTHSYISGVTPQQVATRIAHCFKMESIATKFDADRARVQGETIDHIGFVVQLFAEPIVCNKGKIIVEVQKTKGCSFGYCQIAKAVLNAAEGIVTSRTQPASLPSRPLPPMSTMRGTSPLPLLNRSLPPMPSPVNIQQMSRMPSRTPLPLLNRSLPPIPSPVNNSRARATLPMQPLFAPSPCFPKKDKLSLITEDLDFVCVMLNSNRLDMKLIAMETLLQVTSSTDSECRSFAATGVFSGPIFDVLVKDILCGNTQCEETTKKTEQVGCDLLCKIRRNALTVFGNCLEAVVKSGAAVVKERENILCDELLTRLVNDIGESSTNPHEACNAARCLHSLFQSSPKAMSMGSLNLNAAVMSACRDGVTNQDHIMLEQELMQLEQLMMKA